MIIDDLKQNEKAFGLMSVLMQEAARKIGEKYFEQYGRNWNGLGGMHFADAWTYRLRPDYQEEGGVEKHSIVSVHGRLVYDFHGHTQIQDAPSRPNFIGYQTSGWIYGCVYKNKKDKDYVCLIIPAAELDQYEVLTPTHVLFKSAGDKK